MNNEALTQVLTIELQAGAGGAVTPIAVLSPVELAGTTVSRVSLDNAEEIIRKDIRVGDTVLVELAGASMARIVRVERRPAAPRPADRIMKRKGPRPKTTYWGGEPDEDIDPDYPDDLA